MKRTLFMVIAMLFIVSCGNKIATVSDDDTASATDKDTVQDDADSGKNDSDITQHDNDETVDEDSAQTTCNYDGKEYNVGDSFPSTDGCNTCSCDADFSVSCTTLQCECVTGEEKYHNCEGTYLSVLECTCNDKHEWDCIDSPESLCDDEGCVGPGDTTPVIPDAPKCCDGLTASTMYHLNDDSVMLWCEPMDGASICLKLGNNDCGTGEDICNSPDDCKEPRDTKCDDGDDVICNMIEPVGCKGEFILAAQNGCWECVNPDTCKTGGGTNCTKDEECGDLVAAYCHRPIGQCRAAGVCENINDSGCPEIYAPVCGCDGTTYGNECEAESSGVNIAADGEC